MKNFNMDNQYLRKQIQELNSTFSYDSFFSYSGKNDNGATALITSSQSITIPNIDNGSGAHETTIEQIIQAIYDLPEKQNNPDLNKIYETAIKQSIRIRLLNEHGLKLIWITFPDKIIKKQLDLLKAYQNKYGKIIKAFSNDYKAEEGEDIVGFCTKDEEIILCDSFESAIKYAHTLTTLENVQIQDKFIIGDSISKIDKTSNTSTLETSLKCLIRPRLESGITSEDCLLVDCSEQYAKNKENEGALKNEQ